jgi:hypothetical protein
VACGAWASNFSYQVDALSQNDLAEYFTDLLGAHLWSGVELDLYGWKFFTEHVLRKRWTMPNKVLDAIERAGLALPAAAVAPALALAEPDVAQHPRPNEGSNAAGLPARHGRRTTTRGATVFPLRDAPAMPLLPFMHNVRHERHDPACRGMSARWRGYALRWSNSLEAHRNRHH